MESLGINPVLLLAQIISFLLLWFVLNKFLFGKIQKALDERRSSIKKIFADKEELETRLAKLEKEQEEKRKELYVYGKKIENEAKAAGNEVKKEIVAKAAAEGERELIKARERIEQEVEVAKKLLTKEASNIAREMADKIINEQAQNKDWQKKELDKSMAEMRGKK